MKKKSNTLKLLSPYSVPSKSIQFRSLAIAAVLTVAITGTASAVSGNWNHDGTNNNWSTATSWSSNPTVPGTDAGDVITLTNNITAARTITIDTTPRTVGSLSIGDSNNTHGFTIAASGGGNLIFDNGISNATLTENGSVADTISAPITLNSTLEVTTNGSLTLTGAVSGAQGITKSGASTLTLSGTNSYTGGTTVSAGSLVFANTAAKATTGTHAFAAGSTLGLGVGGTGFFSATDVTNAFAGTMTGNLSNVTVTSTTNVEIDTTAGNFTYNTNITGSPSRGLVKSGANTLIINGANTYTGGFTLNAGTVEFTPTNGSFTGFGTGTLTINGGTIRTAANANFTTANNSVWNGSFTVDRGTTGVRLWNHSGDVVLNNNITVTSQSNGWTTNVTGVMSGTGGLTLAGNALTFTLAGANTYSGGTNMGALNLNINNGGSGGTSSALGTGALTLSGGTINNTSGSAVTLSTNNNLNVNGNFTFTGSNALSFGSGTVSLNGTRTFTINGSTFTVGGFAATGAQGFVKAGAGTLVILGTTGTTGNNTINASGGVVNIRNNGSLGSSGGSTLVNSGGALEFQGGLTGVNEALTLNGTGVSSGGALRNISGNNTLTGAVTLGSATRINSDSGTLTLDRATGNAITGTFNLTLGGAGNITVADPIATSTGTLTKDGAGTVTLSAVNSYTGATNISTGTLEIAANNALPDVSTVTIGSGTLNVATFTDTLGTLDVSAAANINVGTGGAVAFADSSAVDWTGGSLNITGSFVSGSSVRFGTSVGALTTDQKNAITVNGTGAGNYSLDADGFVVAGSAPVDPYATWSSGAPFAGDPNNDGVANGLAFLLGAASPTATATNLLPASSQASGNLTLTFTMLNAASRGTSTLALEHSSDLGVSDAWSSVTVPDTSGTVSGITFTVTPGSPLNTVTATIPASEAAAGKVFGRLKAQAP
jgi:autotransporter-associated beta strand protein